MENNLRVAYSTDDAYVPIVGISIYSLLDNNKDFKQITIYVLDNGISNFGKHSLEKIVSRFKREIVFFDCRKIGDWLGSEVMDMFRSEKTNVPIASYARLFLPSLLPDDVEKILYLDADSLILGNYQRLWKVNIAPYAAMGVLDNVNRESRIKIGLSEDFSYINAGVVLFNIKELRKIDFVQQVKLFIAKYHGRVYHHDQGIINGLLGNKIGILPPEYNLLSFVYERQSVNDIKTLYNIPHYYSQTEIDAAKLNPVFIHFTEGFLQRPWIEHCKHPLKNRWIEYRDKTIWKDMSLQPDMRSIKLKLLAWMNLTLPVGFTKTLLKVITRG